MSTASSPSKITYTSANADMGAFHQAYDEALKAVRAKAGAEHPLWIDGKAVKSSSPLLEDLSPIDTSLVLGKFQAATAEHVDLAVQAARRLQKQWGGLPWQERVQTLRKAAHFIRARKYEIAAVMSLEVGKSRMKPSATPRNQPTSSIITRRWLKTTTATSSRWASSCRTKLRARSCGPTESGP